MGHRGLNPSPAQERSFRPTIAMTAPNTKLLLLFCLNLFAAAAAAAASVADVISFAFPGFKDKDLSLSNLSQITPAGLLRLTNDTQQGIGQAFYPQPLHFKANSSSNATARSFSTSFVFGISPSHPEGGSGHGLTFAVSSTRNPNGQPSEFLGLFPSTYGPLADRVFAIEFDIVWSRNLQDIDDDHVGIDLNSPVSNMSAHAGYYEDSSSDGRQVKKNISLSGAKSIRAWIEYHDSASSPNKHLDVTIAPADVPTKPRTPLMSTTVNLSTIFDTEMYVGFTASTGSATASHYVLAWSFSLGGTAAEIDVSKLPPLPAAQSVRSPNKSSSGLLAITLSMAAVIVLLLLIPLGVYMAIRRRRFAELIEDWEVEYGPHRYSYKELYKATDGFREDRVLGSGGFGLVYKGKLRVSGAEVAVKRISHGSRQGMREFVAEIASMGRLRHRSLVQLLGYCRRQGELLLVYDYMPNASLDRFLYGGESAEQNQTTTLGWAQRFHIIKGVAAGLLYLHEGWEQIVVHRDIKASNVLLDGEFNGRLSDFGLARLYDHGSNPQTTRVVGTLGYLAPEISKTGKATTETDVYAFGIFLLEVACGRRPMEPSPSPAEEPPILADWVLECWRSGAILKVADRKLNGDYVVEEVELVLQLGLICSHPDPAARPGIRQVMQFLEGAAPLPETSPENLKATSIKIRRSEGFDDFLVSYPSMQFTTGSSASSSCSPSVRQTLISSKQR